jgi:aminopeptidase-like protein
MKMREDRKQLLDKIGFAWTVGFAWKVTKDEMKWQEKYAKVVDFKRKNGHCRVPFKYADKGLGQWVAKQRHFYVTDTLA